MVTARSSLKLAPLVALLAVAALWIQPAENLDAQTNGSPVSTYVRFDGIVGESNERNHIDWSDVESINTSVFRPSSATVGATRARARSITEDLIIVKPLDAAGPYLQLAAWNGKVFPTVDIEIVRSGGESRSVLWKIELTNVVVKSYSMGTTGQDDLTPNSLPLVATSMQPTEQVTLGFESAKVTYYELSDDGSVGQEHEVEYDVVAGA